MRRMARSPLFALPGPARQHRPPGRPRPVDGRRRPVGLRGDPEGQVAELIGSANDQPSPVLALDTQSGLDVTTGIPAVPCVRATATLALPKVGLLRAPDHVGRLYLADISVPPLVYEKLGIDVPALVRDEAIVDLGDQWHRPGGDREGGAAAGRVLKGS